MTKLEKHILDCARIEDFDEIDGDAQLVWVWCATHRKLEWHSVPIHIARNGEQFVSHRKPVIW